MPRELIKELADATGSERASCFAAKERHSQQSVLSQLEEDLLGMDTKNAVTAAAVLGDIQDDRCVPALVRAVSHPVPWVRREAVVSLGKLGDRSSCAEIRNALAADLSVDMGSEFGEWVARLQQAEPRLRTYTHERLLPAFESALEAEIRSLGSLEDTEAMPLLSQAIEHVDEVVRSTAAEAIGMIGTSEGASLLLKALRGSETSEAVLGQIVFSLKRIGDPAAISPLRDCPKLRSGRLRALTESTIVALKATKLDVIAEPMGKEHPGRRGPDEV